MTIQQKAITVIGRLPEDKISQVIQFAEFLSFDTKQSVEKSYSDDENNDGYIRKPGILKRKIKMSEDFDETLDCFKGYM